jgi:hypothetical protein
MNVTELIELTNRLSTDKSELTPKERAAYLQYLNMANDELYEIYSSGTPTLIPYKEIFSSAESLMFNNSYIFNYPDNLFKIENIFVGDTELIKGSIRDLQLELDLNKYFGSATSIFISSKLRYPTKLDATDNTNKKYISIFYTPNPKRLVENITDANLETDIPVYPLPYHIFLVHGALYYFYFSNKVFMDKMTYIRKIWEEDKETLTNFKNYGL